jgi:alpha-ribazole phosphatase
MKAVLIRHTRIRAPLGVCYGRTAYPLAATFAEEARGVRAILPWAPTEVWTSPADRCRALADTLEAPVRIDPRLAELDFGQWEGRRWVDFRGPASDAWALDPWTQRPPDGETTAELWARVGRVRSELLSRDSGRIVLVTHAGVIRAWRGLVSGRSLREVWAEPVAFGGVESTATPGPAQSAPHPA